MTVEIFDHRRESWWPRLLCSMAEYKAQHKDPDLLRVEEKFAQSQPLLHHEGAGLIFSRLSALAADSKLIESPLFSFLLRAACNKQPSIADSCLSVVTLLLARIIFHSSFLIYFCLLLCLICLTNTRPRSAWSTRA